MLETYNFTELETMLSQLFPDNSITFSELVTECMNGKLNAKLIINILKSSLLSGIEESKNVFLMIVIIGILSALFVNFGQMFENRQISDIAFYFMYLLLITIIIKLFIVGKDIISNMMEQMLLFMKLLLPTYSLAVGIASGTATASGFYQMALLIIYAIENILVRFFIPASYFYVLLAVMNGLTPEERLTSILEFIKRGINFGLKAVIAIMTGMNLLHNMLTPIIDSVQATAFQKTISLVPGIGKIADSVSGLVLGSAVLIKNSIGVAALLILVVISLVPIIKLCAITICFKLSAAIIGFTADKRMTHCTGYAGDGSLFFLQIGLTVIALFFITIALVAISTNRGF